MGITYASAIRECHAQVGERERVTEGNSGRAATMTMPVGGVQKEKELYWMVSKCATAGAPRMAGEAE